MGGWLLCCLGGLGKGFVVWAKVVCAGEKQRESREIIVDGPCAYVFEHNAHANIGYWCQVIGSESWSTIAAGLSLVHVNSSSAVG